MALDSQGIELRRGDGADPEVFTLVAEVLDLNGPSGSATVKDRTHLKSTAKEKGMGLMDEGQITLEAFLVPDDTAQKGLRTDRKNKTLRNFEIELTDKLTTSGTILSFAAYVTQFAIKPGGVDSDIKADITLEISGEVIWTDPV